MSMNELNERDFYEEPGVNIFEKTVDGKKEWIRKSTLDAISANPEQVVAGLYQLKDGSYTRLSPKQNEPNLYAPPIADSAGSDPTKANVLSNQNPLTAAIASNSWLKWGGIAAVALIGLKLLRKKGK